MWLKLKDPDYSALLIVYLVMINKNDCRLNWCQYTSAFIAVSCLFPFGIRSVL